MTIVYREDDPISARWTGLGRKLTKYEGDLNSYQFETRIATLEANYTLTISLSSVTQPTPSTLLFHKTDSSTDGPFTLPVAKLYSVGAWAPSTPYDVNQTTYINGTVYSILYPHTSGLTFDAGANDGMGHDYYEIMVPNPGSALPTGGATGMVLQKSSGTDYAVMWGYKLPIGGGAFQVLLKQSSTNQDADWTTLGAIMVSFTPPTGSVLVSTNLADVINELESLIGSPTVSAVDVTFTAPTGSSLVSTNVSAALVELETDLANYLPLAGGTMSGPITLAADPASSLQPATKQYVDGIAANLGKRARVRAATTANITISTALNNGDTLDGVTLATGDQVLVKDQSTTNQNGIYIVGATPVRADQFDTFDEHPGSLIAVEEGSTNAETLWLCSSNVGGTLNTTAITFSAITSGSAYLAGTGIVLTGSTFSIDGAIVGRLATANTWALAQTFTVAPVFTDASGTRTALGLGTAATSASTAFQAADAQLFSNIPQNSKSAAYTTVLTDGQKHVFHPSADTTARTFTIDSNANVAYPIGTAITFVNQHSAGVVTIAITSDTMRLAGAGTTGSRTLAADGIATALKIATTEWIISGTGLT